MDANRLFMKMKDTSEQTYKVRQNLYLLGRAFIKYVIFPLVICAVLAGGVFTAADSVTKEKTSRNGMFLKFEKA